MNDNQDGFSDQDMDQSLRRHFSLTPKTMVDDAFTQQIMNRLTAVEIPTFPRIQERLGILIIYSIAWMGSICGLLSIWKSVAGQQTVSGSIEFLDLVTTYVKYLCHALEYQTLFRHELIRPCSILLSLAAGLCFYCVFHILKHITPKEVAPLRLSN